MIIFWSLFPEARKLDNKEGKHFCRNVSESQQRALSYHWSVAAVPSHHWWTLSSSLGLDPGPTFLPDQAWPWRERCAEIQTPFTLQKEITPDLMRLDLCRGRDDWRSSWPQSLILDGTRTMRLSTSSETPALAWASCRQEENIHCLGPVYSAASLSGNF